MRITRQDDGAFLISRVEPPFDDILRAIPASAETDDNAAANERLFPNPASPLESGDLCEEWREYVQPGLRHLFENAVATVESDLEQLTGERTTIAIPARHVDAWLNALNQARLMLAAKFDVTEEDLEHVSNHLQNERDFALFQIHFYGFIQENLLADPA